MSAGGVRRMVEQNDASMDKRTMPEAERSKGWDYCCGIHGAARNRKGTKRGTSAARRRYDKRVIREQSEHSIFA